MKIRSLRLVTVLLLASLILPNYTYAAGNGLQAGTKAISESAIDSEAQVEELLSSMPLKRKVEQMLMPFFRYYYDENGQKQGMNELTDKAAKVLSEHNFGGVILYAENTTGTRATADFVNKLQESNADSLDGSRIPLFISVDQEGGVVTRLATGTSLPGNMAIAASGSSENAFAAGQIIGEELSSLGINVDFSPVVDVNNNPANPVIGTRSFSSKPEKVAEMGVPFMKGLQSKGVMTSLKHFPGHGDTATDSHTGLPSIDKSLEELEECELVPFKAGIDSGTDMIMTAHIEFPQIEKEKYKSKTGDEIILPATLSKTIMKDILREKLGFDGVIVTDGLDMDSIKKYFTNEDVAEKAINADVDILLNPFDTSTDESLDQVDGYVNMICSLVNSGRIAEDEINDSVRRILKLKMEHGILSDVSPADPEKAVKIVGSKAHHDQEWDITAQAMTLLKNDHDMLPLAVKEDTKVAVFTFSEGEAKAVQYALKKLKNDGVIPENADIPVNVYKDKNIQDFSDVLKDADDCLAISRMTGLSWLDPEKGTDARFLDELIGFMQKKGGRAAIISDRLPYDASRLVSANAMLLAYSNKEMTSEPDWENEENPAYGPNIPVAIYTAFGGAAPKGRLPVDIPSLGSDGAFTDNILYEIGTGLDYKEADEPWTALDYAVPGNWIRYNDRSEAKADVFWISPTISGNAAENVENTDFIRKLFQRELAREAGIYSDSASIYAPFYRQMGLNGYLTPNRDKYLDQAYEDVAAAFEYYLEHGGQDRPIILAGFSQGADMCYRLLQNYFGGDGERARALRERLVAAYCLGWAMTEDLTKAYPQIVPAKGEKDTGVVVSFECEDDREPTISGNMIIPNGQKMLSINPLNWSTDNRKADKILNKGALIENRDGSSTVSAGYCGAYIDPERGCLKVTDLTGSFRILPSLGRGSLHLFDFTLFYSNLKENVADRLEAYLSKNSAPSPKPVPAESPANSISSDGTFITNDGKTVIYPKVLPYIGSNWAKYLNNTTGIIYISGNETPLKKISIKMKGGKIGTAEIKKLVFQDTVIKNPGIKIEIAPYEITGHNISQVLDFTKKKENKNKKQVKGLKAKFEDLKVPDGIQIKAKPKKISPKYTAIFEENGEKKVSFKPPYAGTISAKLIGL